MKMKELETRTGIGRETIRYYIREGLLPEPDRPKPNVAIYSDEHVRRLNLIKTLQRERFLPLGVIRQLLDQTGGRELEHTPGLFGMEFMLAARFGAEASRAPVPLDKVASTSNLSLADLRKLDEMDVIDIVNRNGAETVSMQDAAIAHAWGRINGFGFSQEAGYTVEDIEDYRRLADQLAEIEVEHFFSRLSENLDTARATELAERGIPVALEMFGHLRIKAILKKLAARNAEAMAGGEDGARRQA